MLYKSLFVTHQSIPAAMSEKYPVPDPFNTRTATIFAPGATPG